MKKKRRKFYKNYKISKFKLLRTYEKYEEDIYIH